MKDNEKEILRIIKYLPVALILIISSLLTYFLYNQNINQFHSENQKLEEKYISLNKDLTKFQIEKIKSNILYEKKEQIKNLKKELQNQVNNAHNIAYSLYTNNKDKLAREEIISLIKDALREIRFNENRGYFFIYDISSGRNILHPIKPNLENKDLWSYQDTKGTYLLQEMNKILKVKEATYFNWFWTKPDELNKEYEKIGFFKKFEPYDFFIGTGEYIVDFEKQLKQKITRSISDFRYKEDGYVFILDFDGNYLSYYNKEYIGKSLFDFDIVAGQENILKKLKDKAMTSGYLSYQHKDKPFNKNTIKKITYVDSVKDWNWIIGTGFYMDDFYKDLEIKKKYLEESNKLALQKLFIGSIFVTLLLLFIFIYLSRLLEKKFYNYKKSIEKQMNDNIKKDNILAQQSKLAAMGEMLGNIAHQWRQPLSTVSTIVSGIRLHRELGNKDEDLENESFLKIKKHIEYLSNTIDDFSNFFKPNKLAKEFQLEDMINKTLQLVENQLVKEDIILIKEIQNKKIYGFENELIQVLINLINNARDELVKSDEKKLIFISSKKNDKNIIIKIKDNAGGVNPLILDRIFEPYFSTKGDSKGTGIGLFMSEEILVKHLNGSISVENINYDFEEKLYKGAQFTIIFPINHFESKEYLS